MAFLRAFGAYVPSRVVDNVELAQRLDVKPEWILRASGIEQRRYAAAEESVSSLGVHAATDCLTQAGVHPKDIGLLMVASGSGERRFPGPATEIGSALGIAGTPAIDLQMASTGTLFGLVLATGMCASYRNVLVIGTEVMSRTVRSHPDSRDTAILFGDGAGACLVSSDTGLARISDWLLASDGEFARSLMLGLDSHLEMDGKTIILQAARKLPRAITQLVQRNGLRIEDIALFLVHQANLHLLTRVAQALNVPKTRVFQNVTRYGNTSSASLLIAASEWERTTIRQPNMPFILGAFGAGLNWGAVLAVTSAGARS